MKRVKGEEKEIENKHENERQNWRITYEKKHETKTNRWMNRYSDAIAMLQLINNFNFLLQWPSNFFPCSSKQLFGLENTNKNHQ